MDMHPMLLLSFLLVVCGEAKGIEERADEPLTTVVLQLVARVTQLEAQLSQHGVSTTNSNHVAFRAEFHDNPPLLLPGTGAFKFDYTIFNDGGGYDTATGTFRAPVAGVYIISAQFFSYGRNGHNNGRPLIDIRVNGETQVRVGWDADLSTGSLWGEGSDSTTFVTKLNVGDRVSVESAEGPSYTVWTYFHSFFSGALLYAV